MNTKALETFLRRLGQDEALRAEFVALAARHGIEFGTEELSEEALEGVAGGLMARPAQGVHAVGGEASDKDHKSWIDV